MTLTNLGASPASWTLAVNGGDASVAYGVSPSAVSLTAGASTTITVTMTAIKDAAVGGHQGSLEVSSGATSVAHAALYTLVK